MRSRTSPRATAPGKPPGHADAIGDHSADLLRRLDRFGIRQAAIWRSRSRSSSSPKEFESQADNLGLQYMYKAGYDPNAFVDFFEKLEALEKKKQGTMNKVFSDHPPTGERVVKVQKEIQDHLKDRPEYVLTTSEFNDVKAKLLAMHNRRADDKLDPNKPHLNRKPGSTSGSASDGSNSGSSTSGSSTRRFRPAHAEAPARR